MIIEYFIGLVISLFIMATAFISTVGWIGKDKENKALRKENAQIRSDNQKLWDSLLKEMSFASILNLEMEDK